MVGLDPRGARLVSKIFRQLRANGVSVFVSTHTLSLAGRPLRPDRHYFQGPAVNPGLSRKNLKSRLEKARNWKTPFSD